jgi:hypothetical protein
MKLTLIFCLLASLNALAGECDKDVKKYCSGVEPGKNQIYLCLSQYEASLSPQCKTELRAFKTKTEKKNPCFEDLSQFCSDIPSDPQNFEYCLFKNEGRLAHKCAIDFAAKKVKIMNRNPCAPDIAYQCYSSIPGPEGSVTKCLIKNKNKLTLKCQASVEKKIGQMRSKNPCFHETEKFCPSAVRFVDIQDCLVKKIQELNPQCKKLVERESAKLNANPCYRDLITHCKAGLAPHAQDECLKLNEEHLSRTCRDYRSQEYEKVEKLVKFCEADRVRLCKDSPLKDGAVLKCLKTNKAKVSPVCQKLL